MFEVKRIYEVSLCIWGFDWFKGHVQYMSIYFETKYIQIDSMGFVQLTVTVQ